jgi:cytochrome c553
MYRRALFVTLSVCALIGMQAPAGAAENPDPSAGRIKAVLCTGCHTSTGMRINRPQIYRIPKIGGQHAEYLVTALQAYKSGERKNETMRALVASLSDQDIQDLAAYFAGLPWE